MRLHLDDYEVFDDEDEDEEDKSDLCIVETYCWVHLTSHNMHIADVTAHFLVHLWEKSPHLHRVPGCQPSTFFLTLSTNNRIQGVCSVANFRGEKVMQTVLGGTTLLYWAFVFFFLNFSLSLFLSFFCLCFWTKVIQTFFGGDHPA